MNLFNCHRDSSLYADHSDPFEHVHRLEVNLELCNGTECQNSLR